MTATTETENGKLFWEFVCSWEPPHYRVYFDWSKWENQIQNQRQQRKTSNRDGLNFNKRSRNAHTWMLSRPCRRLESIELKRQWDWHFNLKIHSTIFSGVCVNFEDAKISFVLFAFEAHAICDPLTVDQFVHLLYSCPDILDTRVKSNEFIFFLRLHSDYIHRARLKATHKWPHLNTFNKLNGMACSVQALVSFTEKKYISFIPHI